VSSLEARGITVAGPSVPRSGAVVSLVTEGQRSLASDGGSPAWLDEVTSGAWLDGVDWLFVSGYALLRAADPAPLVRLTAGRRVAVDLSSAAMIEEYGADRFRALWQSLSPAVVFANDDEWSVCRGSFDGTLVLKHGARGATFDGVHQRALPADVVDVTGAGDALAAGWFVGGEALAMQAAARCVEQVGAQPPA
jgi:ribokinase